MYVVLATSPVTEVLVAVRFVTLYTVGEYVVLVERAQRTPYW